MTNQELAVQWDVTRRQASRLRSVAEKERGAAIEAARALNDRLGRTNAPTFPNRRGQAVQSWLRPRIGKTARQRGPRGVR